MSLASKSKSKDKVAAMAVKETPKGSLKGPLVGGYNPVSGTFQALEPMPSASLPGAQYNGRFRTMDELDGYSGSSFDTTAEYDSGSTNGSYSGESEDHKEKAVTTTAARALSIPGADTDKRDKIRQQNEKKHQRQREKRSQELHERCSGYLMSRKLEVLSQQLVAMGFSSELATMALILHEGRVEESVAWLFEGCEENKQQIAANMVAGASLKIDIADELAVISDLEVKFSCTSQEVEKAVIACEGDLEKAEGILKAQKQEEAAAVPAKLEDLGDRTAAAGLNNKPVPSVHIPMVRTQANGVASWSIHQQRRDERDLNYTNAVATGTILQEAASMNLQTPGRTEPPKLELVRAQAASQSEKRWLTNSSSSSSTSYSSTYPLQAAAQLAKEYRRVMAGSEVKPNLNALVGNLREPVIVMQRPKSINAKPSLPSAGVSVGASLNGLSSAHVMSASLNSSSSLQYYSQNHLQALIPSTAESAGAEWNGSSRVMRKSSSLVAPSSLGLFTRWGSNACSSLPSVDWSDGGLMPQCDYSSIDWSLDLAG